MKRILFLIVAFWVATTIAIAQTSYQTYQNITLTVSDKEDTGREILEDTNIQPGGGPQARGVVMQPVYAYLYNNVVSIDFTEAFSAATVTIINETTGETVYSETSSNPVNLNIDLSGESNGCYTIEIETDDTYLQGSFSL